MSQGKKAAWWFVTAAVCIFSGIFALTSEPTWWTTVIALAVPIASIIFGKPWQPPEAP